MKPNPRTSDGLRKVATEILDSLNIDETPRINEEFGEEFLWLLVFDRALRDFAISEFGTGKWSKEDVLKLATKIHDIATMGEEILEKEEWVYVATALNYQADFRDYFAKVGEEALRKKREKLVKQYNLPLVYKFD